MTRSRGTSEQMMWYIEHRIEYLENQEKKLRDLLSQDLPTDFAALQKFLEIKGRLKELRALKQRGQDLHS